ncbi:S8 family serine peptidase [Symbioplanes lichenis]|uniref:S8 family serine peptidase n=1 Tax=Symbioplanes lichenis TaxID=1629072 RepID=UPI0027388DD9|nr:S8 family serine peptidase [Actinoplanes lichenis]
MRRRSIGVVVALLAAGIGAPAHAAEPEGTIRAAGGATAVEGSYIVVLKERTGAVEETARALASARGGAVVRTYSHALRGFEARLGERAARQLAADPAVASVTQTHTVTASDVQAPVPSWGLDRIDQRALPVDGSYRYRPGDPVVTAYVIDGGINLPHSDFAGRIRSGRDFIDNDDTATDCKGHGTHVAGTIGGTTYGVAKNVELVAVRVLDCQGTGTTATVMAGIDWVTADHAAGTPAVANMSLNGRRYAPEEEAITRSIADGITYVVSAGNDSGADACANSPAGVPAAITVGATGPDDQRAAFSNIGPCVDLFAPGVDIVSSSIGSDTATATGSGTSMAAPHVTGAAALILADHPDYTPAQVADELTAGATTGVVGEPGAGTPNRLLHVDATPPAGDFAVAVTPSAATVSAGDSVTTTLTAGQPVTWKANGLPAGATAAFDGDALTISTTARTAPGTYRLVVTGASAMVTRAARLTLTVTATPGCIGANDTDTPLAESNWTEIPVTITGCGASGAADSTVEVHAEHGYVGDLTVELVAPSGRRYDLLEREGDDADAISYTFTVDLSAEPADGVWKLAFLDNGPYDVGSFDSWVLDLGGEQLPGPVCGGLAPADVPIPERATVESPITVSGCDRAPSAASYIEVRVVHPWERDLGLYLLAPDGERIDLQQLRSSGQANIFRTYIADLSGRPANGEWRLVVEDLLNGNEEGGFLDNWRLTL